MMFPGLTSRWTSPRSWAKSSALATCSRTASVRPAWSLPSCSRTAFRSVPSTKRMAMYRSPFVSSASYTGMMLGWSREPARSDSRMKRSRNSSSEARFSARTLMAALRVLIRRCWAR